MISALRLVSLVAIAAALVDMVPTRAAERSAAQQQPAAKAPGEVKPPRAAITISKETTWITGPLRKDGYVDYIAALNERCRQGVTVESNSAVPFLRAMWPAEIIDPKHREECCRTLGIPTLPDKGDYFVRLEKYARPGPDGGNAQDETWEQLTQAMKRPWTPKDFPRLADWLAANEKPLSLVLEASKRPRRYDPLLSVYDSVIAVLLPTVQVHREAARALTARAMLRTGQGKVDEAWSDLLACHRLARLAGQGTTLIEALVAIAVDGLACAGDQGLLAGVRLSARQAASMREDLAKLPPLPVMADKIDLGERFIFLDCVAMLAREGLSSLNNLVNLVHGNKKSDGILTSALDAVGRSAVDWDHILRMGNSWYDRMVAAGRKPTRPERQEAFRKIDEDIRKLAAEVRDPKSIALSLLGGTRKAISERLGQMLVALVLPAISGATNAEDRGTMQLELTKLAFALAAYRADHGSYPAELTDLTPKYLRDVSKDVFGGGDLHYAREGKGYVLYSVGVNGKDDGAKGREDAKLGETWDDLVVRIRE
jgi:hypothetical protein